VASREDTNQVFRLDLLRLYVYVHSVVGGGFPTANLGLACHRGFLCESGDWGYGRDRLDVAVQEVSLETHGAIEEVVIHLVSCQDQRGKYDLVGTHLASHLDRRVEEED